MLTTWYLPGKGEVSQQKEQTGARLRFALDSQKAVLLRDGGVRAGASAGSYHQWWQMKVRPDHFYTRQRLLNVSLHGNHCLGRLRRLESGSYPQAFWLRTHGWGLEICISDNAPVMLLVQRLQFEDYFYGVWVFEHWGAPEHFLRSVTKTDLHFIRNTWVEIVKTGLRR